MYVYTVLSIVHPGGYATVLAPHSRHPKQDLSSCVTILSSLLLLPTAAAAVKYPMTPTLPNQPILRAVLPTLSSGPQKGHQLEAEVLVPWGWPGDGSSLQLLQVQSSAGSVHESVMQSLEEQPGLAQGPLGAFLDAVHASCASATVPAK